jgi:hypothetical protein
MSGRHISPIAPQSAHSLRDRQPMSGKVREVTIDSQSPFKLTSDQTIVAAARTAVPTYNWDCQIENLTFELNLSIRRRNLIDARE